MKKKNEKKVFGKGLLFIVICILGTLCMKQKVQASFWENPYISFSPDGKAFTTNAQDTLVEWYEKGYTVYTGNVSKLRTPNKGEHLYPVILNENVRVGRWVVDNTEGHCVHNQDINISDFHGVEFAYTICQKNYYSGWWGYCADCNQKVVSNYFYMSEDAASSIKELNMSLAYYYLCPWCTHLEQGCELEQHVCKGISANQYSVRYHANLGTGYMEKSVHMYNNATEYEGKEIIPQKTLSLNCYTRDGYEFVGWNTKMDGSGRSFLDGQEIFNLCSGEQESITLYAQWAKYSEESLWPVITEPIRIDMDENVYLEEDIYYVKADGVTPFAVSFNSRLQGDARENYQINQLSFQVENVADSARNGKLSLQIPVESEIVPTTSTYANINLSKQYEGTFFLTDTSFSEGKRKNYCRDVTINQKFCISKEWDGTRICLTPGAGVALGQICMMSDPALDAENSICLIADGEGPIISGLEIPEDVIDKNDGKWEYTLEIKAVDMGCGVDAFWLEIENKDNGKNKRIEDEDKDGRILLEMTPEELLFAGRFLFVAGARDKVGNESAQAYGMDGITISATIEKVLDPQSDIFKKGESGHLHIRASGYIERIEVVFPEEWREYAPNLNKVYHYQVPDFMEMEELDFMVPLPVEDNKYAIVVKGYKGEKIVEVSPQLLTIRVAGSVLDEIRTRLR